VGKLRCAEWSWRGGSRFALLRRQRVILSLHPGHVCRQFGRGNEFRDWRRFSEAGEGDSFCPDGAGAVRGATGVDAAMSNPCTGCALDKSSAVSPRGRAVADFDFL